MVAPAVTSRLGLLGHLFMLECNRGHMQVILINTIIIMPFYVLYAATYSTMIPI